MSQQTWPNADYYEGGWAPVPLWPHLDGPVPNDAAPVTSPALLPSSSFTVDLAPLAAPIAGVPEDAAQPHTLLVRLNGCCASAVVTLLDTVNGATRWIKSQLFELSPGFRDYAFTLSYLEAARIEDYTTLQVMVTAYAGGSNSSCSCSSSSPSYSPSSSASSSRGSGASSSRSSSRSPSASSGRSSGAPSSGASGSSGSSSAGFTAPCCSSCLTPTTLYLTMTGASASYGPFPMTWNPAQSQWETGLVSLAACGTFNLALMCKAGDSLTGFFNVLAPPPSPAPTCLWANDIETPVGSCCPVYFQTQGTFSGCGSCNGAYTITVTE